MKLGAGSFLVLSQQGNQLYKVTAEREGANIEYTCECLAFAIRKNMCKHIYAAALHEGILTMVQSTPPKTSNIPRGPQRKCRPQKRRKITST